MSRSKWTPKAGTGWICSAGISSSPISAGMWTSCIPTRLRRARSPNYKHLVVPHNSLYDLGDNAALEAAVGKFVAAGGTVFHGPHCELAKRAFGIEEETIAFDCIKWHEEIIPHGWSTVACRGGTALGKYIQSGKARHRADRHWQGPGVLLRLSIRPRLFAPHDADCAAAIWQTRNAPRRAAERNSRCRAGRRFAADCRWLPSKASNSRASGNISSSSTIAPARWTSAASNRAKRSPQVPSAPGWLAAHSAVCLEL